MATTTATKLRSPLRVLPIVEQWDCHSCGICCKAHTVFLDKDDLERLKSQEWEKHPDFAGKRITRRVGLFRQEHVLAQQKDGSCVFLTKDGLCSIHKEHGEPAKPWACRMFPFQVLPTAKGHILTMRRNCPSAAANKGRPLRKHLDYVRGLAGKAIPDEKKLLPPRIIAGTPRNWTDCLLVTDALQRLMLAELPLVRKLCHGLAFCETIAQCKPTSLVGGHLRELVEVAETSAPGQVAQNFREREPLSPAGAVLFRQAAAEYMRFHPNIGDRPGMLHRVKLLWAAIRIARGKGELPSIHPELPHARFEDLERPLGSLPAEVLQPIHSYFEAMTSSAQYCGAGRAGWPVIDGFRALAFAYPAAMWALRWFSAGREPTVDDAINVICIIDRSHYYPLLNGYRHRKRLHTLVRLGGLMRAIVWYAR